MLDMTGDVMVEDMKDFLGSSEVPRNLAEDDAEACAILIR